jgi:hypothetical protein
MSLVQAGEVSQGLPVPGTPVAIFWSMVRSTEDVEELQRFKEEVAGGRRFVAFMVEFEDGEEADPQTE